MKTKMRPGWFMHPDHVGVFQVFSVRHSGGDALFYCQFDGVSGGRIGNLTKLDFGIWSGFVEIRVPKEKRCRTVSEDLFSSEKIEIDRRIKTGSTVKVSVGTEKGRCGTVTEIYGANVVISFDRGEVELVPIWDVKFERSKA
jgi:hypothetical protein